MFFASFFVDNQFWLLILIFSTVILSSILFYLILEKYHNSKKAIIGSIMILIIFSYIGFLIYKKNDNEKQQTIQQNNAQQFNQSIDDKIHSMSVFIVRNKESIGETIPRLDIGFDIAHLHVRFKVPFLTKPNEVDTRCSIEVQSINAKNPVSVTHRFTNFIRSDTLFIPINLIGVDNKPFESLRDLQAMWFSPHLQKDLINHFSEISLVVNGWIITKCKIEDANWEPQQIDWKLFETGTILMKPWNHGFNESKPPKALWRIDFHSQTPTRMYNPIKTD